MQGIIVHPGPAEPEQGEASVDRTDVVRDFRFCLPVRVP